MADDQERTEPATPKRRREAREAGQVARSPEVVTAFLLGSAALGLWLGAGYMFDGLAALCTEAFRFGPGVSVTPATAPDLAERAVAALGRSLAPLFVAVVVGAVAGNVVQVGFLVSFQAVAPDVERIDPFRGLRRLLTRAKLIELVRDLAKVAVVGWMAYLVFRRALPELPYWSDLVPRDLLQRLLLLGLGILKYVLLGYAFVALLDYGLHRWQYEQKLRMSRREVADEQRETEGDPTVRGRVRALRRELARRRMLSRVSGSDVVVTNPTHFAVALRYDRSDAQAPRVLAKGADRVAERMARIAREHRVPLYEDPSVARALFRSVEIDDPVPPDLFPAVAEILASVYRIRRSPPPG